MRVLHVDTGKTWRGGQQQAYYLHEGLLREGVESLLACSLGGELERRARGAGLPVVGLPLRGELDLISAWRLGRYARRRGVTHLHAHSSHAQTYVLLGGLFSNCRNRLSTRRVDFVPSRHALNRWKYGSLSRLITVSAAIGEIMLGFGFPRERLRVVHDGADVDRVAPGQGHRFREELGIQPDEPLVGNVAHLVDHKGQRYFLDAMPEILGEFPTARFVLVGEGELESELRQQAARLGLGDRVLFTGFRNDVPVVLDALDVFVMCSHLEGLGSVVIEALAAGKAVVGTAAGGIPEIVRDGVDGLIVPVRDPHGIAREVRRLLGDAALSRRLRESGRSRVREDFSVAAMVRGNLSVYRELGS